MLREFLRFSWVRFFLMGGGVFGHLSVDLQALQQWSSGSAPAPACATPGIEQCDMAVSVSAIQAISATDVTKEESDISNSISSMQGPSWAMLC